MASAQGDESTTGGDGAKPNRGKIPQIIITAQKTEQALERVPIAVTAFDSGALARQQINTFSDLQFNVPNVTFSKANFTSSNFQIRGVGNTLVAASADLGVGVQVNGVPLVQPMLFETEYSTSSGSKSCAARRAPCRDATRPAVPST